MSLSSIRKLLKAMTGTPLHTLADSLLWIISGILDELFKRFFVSRSG
jgi:hypothetical protein